MRFPRKDAVPSLDLFAWTSTSLRTLHSLNEKGPLQLAVEDHARKDVNVQTELEAEPENDCETPKLQIIRQKV